MELPVKLRARAPSVEGVSKRMLARVTFNPVVAEKRPDYFFVLARQGEPVNVSELDGYAAVLLESGAEQRIFGSPTGPCNRVSGYEELDFMEPDSIVSVEPTGATNVLYRPSSKHNSIFATGRCNSNCLMCSQPPVLSDDNSIVSEHLRYIQLINSPPEALGITGGEPTLLGHGLIRILSALKERCPNTHIHMLTNGRLYAYEDFVKAISEVSHPRFLSAIPLYADVALDHDYVVQAKGAFDQTLKGLYNAARHRLTIEIRVVLHRQTIPRLPKLVEFIYRNLPFASHVALMGLENMGYVKKNWQLLWIDPLDYAEELEKSVKYLFYRGMPVSIYNLPLCVLPKSVWRFARQSISDYKNIYIEECDLCEVRNSCAGLFHSGKERHSRGIRAMQMTEREAELLLDPRESCPV